MRSKRIPAEEQYRLIMECRQSGLTDHQWCVEHDIKPGTFYNWVKRLRQKGCMDLPASTGRSHSAPEKLKGKSNYYLTDDDRLFWWDGTDEVVISEEMTIWLEELADRHRKLMELPDAGCEDRFESSNFIKNFMILLDEICSYYKVLPQLSVLCLSINLFPW